MTSNQKNLFERKSNSHVKAILLQAIQWRKNSRIINNNEISDKCDLWVKKRRSAMRNHRWTSPIYPQSCFMFCLHLNRAAVYVGEIASHLTENRHKFPKMIIKREKSIYSMAIRNRWELLFDSLALKRFLCCYLHIDGLVTSQLLSSEPVPCLQHLLFSLLLCECQKLLKSRFKAYIICNELDVTFKA